MNENALPARYNIDTFIDLATRRVFHWKIDGVAPDLSLWTARFRIGQYGKLVKEVPGAATTAVDGSVSLEIPAETVPVGTYSYVIDLFDADDAETRFMVGTLRVAEVFP